MRGGAPIAGPPQRTPMHAGVNSGSRRPDRAPYIRKNRSDHVHGLSIKITRIEPTRGPHAPMGGLLEDLPSALKVTVALLQQCPQKVRVRDTRIRPLPAPVVHEQRVEPAREMTRDTSQAIVRCASCKTDHPI
jgi:hypothetical protein